VSKVDNLREQIVKLQKSKVNTSIKLDMGSGAKLILTRWQMKHIQFAYTSSAGITSSCGLSKGQMKKVFGVKI